MPFNTVFQVQAMLRDGSPPLAAGSDLLFMPDLFNYFLTGTKASEFTMATTSQLFNPRTKAWEPGILRALGLPPGLLEDLVEPGTVLSPLLSGIAAEAGLPELPVVAVASHDTASAVAAVPAEGDNWAYISSGTWSLVGIEAGGPFITASALEHNFTNEGGIGGTTRFLKNVTGLWLVQGCRKSWEKERTFGYDELVAMAAAAPAFEALIDPDNPDFLNPPDMPEAIRAYCHRTGQSPPATQAGFVRSILESLALKYRAVIDEIRDVTGRTIGRIHVIGGGSRNRLLCQFTSDATGLPVVAGPAEATAIGNLLVQAMALGELNSLDGLRRIVADSFELHRFEPRGDRAWADAYGRFGEITRP
jgi:rhamnulokinase